jgi:hypothetical protein
VASIDFDWDRFEAEGKELQQRMRAVVAELNRQKAASSSSPPSGGHSLAREQPPPDSAWDGRFDRYERMLTETLSAVTVLQRDVGALKEDVGALKENVGAMKRDVQTIREQMATKVELEALRDSINIVADGFVETQVRLAHVADLLKRHFVS